MIIFSTDELLASILSPPVSKSIASEYLENCRDFNAFLSMFFCVEQYYMTLDELQDFITLEASGSVILSRK
jgi:hypothetical protein